MATDAAECTVTVRAPKQLVKQFDKIAKAEGRTRGGHLRYLMQRAVLEDYPFNKTPILKAWKIK